MCFKYPFPDIFSMLLPFSYIVLVSRMEDKAGTLTFGTLFMTVIHFMCPYQIESNCEGTCIEN